MEKRIILPSGNDVYAQELECVLDTQASGIKVLAERELSTDYLLDNGVEVIISNGLSEHWYNRFRQLNIVSLTIGPLKNLHKLCDIVIDCAASEDNKYFSGSEFSVRQNGFDVIEIANLIMKLDFDSQFFGFPIAYITSKYLTRSIIHRTDQFIRNNQIQLVEYLCNCHDDTSVRIAEENGFHFTDIRLSLFMKTDFEPNLSCSNGIRFGVGEEKDIPHLRKIGEGIYRDSRYYFDGNFDEQRITDFYKSWIEKGVRGQFDDCCYCIYDHDAPVGFCTMRYSSNDIGRIGVFGISKEYQGKGLGKVLLNNTIKSARDKGVKSLYVVTQGRNYYAQRLYQSVGFRTHGNELWYHKWIK
jgi:dTDP-4-amino-4,6-dideoxy-D-galactose acyltransferase